MSEIIKWIAHFDLYNDEVEETLNPKPKVIDLPPETEPAARVEIFKGIM